MANAPNPAANPFAKAVKIDSKGRIAIFGPYGSGKTWTALTIATYFVQMGWATKIAGIDSEKGSMKKYADDFDFDVLELDTYAPRTYVEAIKTAERHGYDFIIIDSLTHAWTGKEGALEQVDLIGKKSQSGNKFNAWRDVTPMHNELIDAMIGSSAHIVATLRVKTEYVIEEVNGKKVPRKVGLQPVQRDGMEYEFDVTMDMNIAHEGLVGKTRCNALDGKFWLKPGRELADIFGNWLQGAPPPPKKKTAEELEQEKITDLITDPEVKDIFDQLRATEASRINAARKYQEKPALLEAIKKRLADRQVEDAKNASKEQPPATQGPEAPR